MKKIIFISRALWMGGVEVALISLINNMDYDKYDVTCLITSRELLLKDRIDSRCHIVVCDRSDEEYKYKRIYGLAEKPNNPSKLHERFMWMTPLFKCVEQRLFSRYVKSRLKENYDVAVIYDIYVAEIAVRGIKAKKFFMYYHHGAMGHAYHDEIGYKKSEKIIVVSNSLLTKMKIANPQYAKKMINIHNIIDSSNIISKSKEKIQLSSFFNIVTCGRLSHEKGMDVAVMSCKELIKNGIKEFRWYIIGGGREESNIRKMIQNEKLDDYMIMVGEVDNPYPYIANADLFVQTSRKEGHSLTLLEALTLKRVIVSTDTDGTDEILQNGKLGQITECNPRKIGENVIRLIKDRELYNQFKTQTEEFDVNSLNEVEMKKFYSLIED